MRDAQKIAIEAAKEITIAAMQGNETPLTIAGDVVANFFETIYNKVFELAKIGARWKFFSLLPLRSLRSC